MITFWKKKKLPDFINQYIDLIKREGFTNDHIALDMETTDINVKKAEVISFGAVALDESIILPYSEVHVKFHTNAKKEENIVIHELIDDEQSLTFDQYLPEVLNIVSNKTIIGHFIKYDIAIINRYLSPYKFKLKNPTIDTLRLALKYDRISDYRYVQRDQYTLYALCERFGIDVHTTHDALEDAYLSALLYLYLS